MALNAGYKPTPTAFFPFDNVYLSSGNPQNQINTSVYTATTASAATGQSGQFGESFEFYGDSVRSQDGGVFWTDSTFDFDRTDAFSVSAWFKTDGDITYTLAKVIVAKWEANTAWYGGQTTNGKGWQIILGSTGILEFIAGDHVQNVRAHFVDVTASGNSGLDDGNWHHVVVTYSGNSAASGVTMYIDGSSVSLTTWTDAIGTTSFTNSAAFSVGARGTAATSNLVFDGNIDEVGVWDGVVLTAAQVTDLYNNTGVIMARTFMRTEQMSGSISFSDSETLGSGMETTTSLRTLDDDLNNLRSVVKNLAGETNWYDDVVAVGGVQRNHAQLHTHVDALMSGSRPIAGVTLEGNLKQTGTTFDVDTTGAVTVDSSAAGISLDGAAASNFTVDSADLTLSTTTSGELDLTSAGLMDVNAGANLDVDVTGTFAVDASSTFSIDGSGASNVTTDSGNLTLSATTSGNVVVQAAAGAVDIDADSGALSLDGSSGINIGTEADVAIDMNSSTLDIDASDAVTLDSTAGISLGASSASDFTVLGAALTLSGSGLVLDAENSTVDVDAAGAITVDSSGAGISLDAAGASNFTTSAGALTLQGASSVSVSASGGDVTVEGTTFSGNDVTIPGDLTVQGTTTTLETTNATVKDSLIALGSSSSGIDTNADRGLLLPRTDDVSKAFYWDHSESQFALVDTWSSGSDTAIVVDAYQDLRMKDLTVNDISAAGLTASDLTDNRVVIAGTSGVLEDDANFTFDGSDLQLADNIGMVFSTDDAEKIESDGTDLTVNSGGDINLTATSDVNLPSSVGLTFGDDGEKIEGDGTDLTVSTSNDLNFSVTADFDVDAATVTVDTSGAISLDAAATSNFTVLGAALTLSASGVNIDGENSEVDITTAGALDLNSGAGTWSPSTLAFDPSSTFDLDAAGAITMDGATLTIGGDGDTGAIDIDSTGAVTIDAVGTSNFATNGGLLLSGSTSVTLTSDGGAAAISSRLGGVTIDASEAGDIVVTSTEGGVDLAATNSTDADAISIQATSGGVDIDGAEGVEIDSLNAAVNITAGAASLFSTAAGDLAASAAEVLDLDGGTDVDIDAVSAVHIDAGTTMSLDSADTTNFTMAANTSGGTDKTMTISATNAGSDEALISMTVDDQIDIVVGGAATFQIDGTAGSLSSLATWDVDTSGLISFDSSGGAISLDSAAASNFSTTAGALTLSGSGGLVLGGSSVEFHTDGTYGIANGLLLTSGSGDVDTFLSNFGEGDQDIIGAINKVYDLASGGNISKEVYIASGSIAADTAIEGISMTESVWHNDDINVHLNGVLQRSGSQGQNDVYRDSSGNLKFNFALVDGDFIAIQTFGS